MIPTQRVNINHIRADGELERGKGRERTKRIGYSWSGTTQDTARNVGDEGVQMTAATRRETEDTAAVCAVLEQMANYRRRKTRSVRR